MSCPGEVIHNHLVESCMTLTDTDHLQSKLHSLIMQWQRCSAYILEELQWCVVPSLASLCLPAAASGFIQALETPQPRRLTVSHENGFEQRRD